MDPIGKIISCVSLLATVVNVQVKVTLAATEVLKNVGFENADISSDWSSKDCNLTRSRDSYGDYGYYSLKVTVRDDYYTSPPQNVQIGPTQNVQVTAGANYKFTGFIKFTYLPYFHGYDMVEVMMNCTTPSKSDVYLRFGIVPNAHKDVWTKIGGIALIPTGAHSCHIYVQTKLAGSTYLVDNLSLQKFPDDPNWLSQANDRINKLRKADLTVTMQGPRLQQYDLEIKQIKHDFAFGTAVGASQMVDPAFNNYQDFVYNNFEWAVLENALKWTQLEHRHNHVDYSKALAAVNILRNHGIKVRGNNLVTGIERHCPSWLKNMTETQVKIEIEKHIADAVNITMGLVEQWDVNNENLHGEWFEQKTDDPNITMKMFEKAHGIDHDGKFFLNDYDIMDGSYAMALRDQAKMFKDAGLPIYGVGIQSHIKNPRPYMAVYMKKLDTVAEAELPIWITELTVNETDAATKATVLRDVMTLYFSHPAVEGVLLGGFWDGNIFDKSASLFEGPNFTPNAAGRVWQTLFHTTWRTDEHHVVSGGASVKVRGFRGQYQLTVKHGGQQIAQETFPVHATGKNVNVNVGGGGASIIVG